jgi:serine protease Do
MKNMHRLAYVTVLTVGVGCLLMCSVFASAQEAFLWKTDDEGGWLGVSIQDLTIALKEAMNYDRDVGVLVNDVEDDSPAEKAGIQEGDIIIQYDGKAISNTGSLIRKVRATDPGEKVDIGVVRKGREVTVTATIDEKSTTHGYWFEPGNKGEQRLLKGEEEGGGWLGIHLQNLTVQLGEYFGISDGEGALVTEVIDDSPAEKAGLKAGDVIVSYGGDEIDGAEELIDAVRESEKGEDVEIEIMRNKSKRMVRAEIGETPQKYRRSKRNLFELPHFGKPSLDDYLKRWEHLEEEDEPQDKMWQYRIHGDIEEDDIRDLQKRLRKLEREIEKIKDRL